VAAKKPVAPAPKKKPEPSGKVGNYRAPVDTAGMDPKMKELMGFGKKKGKK